MTSRALPHLWIQAQIDDLCSSVILTVPQSQGTGSFQYVDISSVDNEAKVITAVSTVLNTEAPSRARQIVAKNDVLVSTVRPNLNAVAIVPNHLDGAICSTGFCVLRPKPEILDPDYLFAWVRHPHFITQLIRMARGIGYPAVSDSEVRSVIIPLPPLPEQQHIVAILREADELRRLRREADERARDLLPALFREMFGVEAVRRNRWKIKKISDFGEVQYGITVNSVQRKSKNSFPYLRVANVQRGTLNLVDIAEIGASHSEAVRFRLQSGDVLVVEGHANIQELGRAAIWNDELPFCLHQNHLLRIRPYSDVATSNYIANYINSQTGIAYMSRYGKTSSGLNTINSKVLAQMPIPEVPIEIQEAFEQQSAEYQELFADTQTTAQDLNNLFLSFLGRAFSGKLTIQWREQHADELREAAVQRDTMLGLRATPTDLAQRLGRLEQTKVERLIAEQVQSAARQVVQSFSIQATVNFDIKGLIGGSLTDVFAENALASLASVIKPALPDMSSVVSDVIASSVANLNLGLQASLASAVAPLTEIAPLRLFEAFDLPMEEFQRSLARYLAETAALTSSFAVGMDSPHGRRPIFNSLTADTLALLMAADSAATYFRPEDLIEELERYHGILAKIHQQGDDNSQGDNYRPNDNGTDLVEAEEGLRLLVALGFVRRVQVRRQLRYRMVDTIEDRAALEL